MATIQHLQEDTVFYKVFPPLPSIDLVQSAILYTTSILGKQLERHIWHYESFHLTPSKDSSCLTGSTCYHGNVDDEWFIVKLLISLTKEVDGLVATISDNDGQFLLIEAAHHLPKWLKPETAENRVFLYQGKIHIIPQPRSPGEVPFFPVTTPTLGQGMVLVRNSLINTVASLPVQKCIHNRIEKCTTPLHCTHVYLPLPAAHILSTNKQLISSVIHALIERNKEDMKVANKLLHFSPQHFPMILIDLTMPRLLYAMLVNDKLAPPTLKRAGHQTSAHLLGAKLMYGLEILVTCYGHKTSNGNHTQWEEFIKSLTRNGYFENEIEGSLCYQSLLKTAKDYYSELTDQEINSSVLSCAGKEVRKQLNEKAWSEDNFKDCPLQPPDDDDWMTIKPEELDKLLKERGTSFEATPIQLDDMSYGVKSFVDQVSSLEGAEFPWTADNVDPVEFSSDEFVNTLEDMFAKMEAMNNDNESLTSEEEEEEEDGESCEEDKENIHDMMVHMDQELSQTTMANSFKTVSGKSGCGLEPIDIDFNLVQNLLDNYNEQLGEATPTSNILTTLGLSIDSQNDD